MSVSLSVLLTAEHASAQAIFSGRFLRACIRTFVGASAESLAVASESIRLMTHGALLCPNVFAAVDDAAALRAFTVAVVSVVSTDVAVVDAADEERSDENDRSAQTPFHRAQTRRMIQILNDQTSAPLMALRDDVMSFFVADIAVSTFADAFTSAAVCQSFVDALHRRLIVTADIRGAKAESALLPCIMSLTAVVSALPHARRIVKRIVFRSAAEAPTSAGAVANNMIAANAPSERRLDDDDFAVNALIIARLTSTSPQIASAVGELLFRLSDSTANEMIRLCGFGNAVGYLRSKGLL